MRALESFAKQQRALQHLIPVELLASVLLAASSGFHSFRDLASGEFNLPSAAGVKPRQS